MMIRDRKEQLVFEKRLEGDIPFVSLMKSVYKNAANGELINVDHPPFSGGDIGYEILGRQIHWVQNPVIRVYDNVWERNGFKDHKQLVVYGDAHYLADIQEKPNAPVLFDVYLNGNEVDRVINAINNMDCDGGLLIEQYDIESFNLDVKDADPRKVRFRTMNGVMTSYIECEESIELMNVYTKKEDIVNVLKRCIKPAFWYGILKVFNTKVNDSVDVSTIRRMFSTLVDNAEHWIKNSQAPKLEYGIVGLRPWDTYAIQKEYQTKFNDFWNEADKYISYKEGCEAFITMVQMNACDRYIPEMISSIQDMTSGHHIVTGLDGSYARYDLETFVSRIQSRFNVERSINIDALLYILNEENVGFKHMMVGEDDYETEYYAAHTMNSTPYIKCIVPFFIEYKTEDFKSYIPKLEELHKVIAAKRARHEAREMDFSKCTMSNVTNYVDERKCRIKVLSLLEGHLKLAIEFINDLKQDTISLFDIISYMSNLSKDGKISYAYRYSNLLPGISTPWVEEFFRIFDVIHMLDSIQGDTIDLKFNLILRTMITPETVNSFDRYNVTATDSKRVADFSVSCKILDTISSILEKSSNNYYCEPVF